MTADVKPRAEPRRSDPLRARIPDDVAYLLPMIVFLALLYVGTTWQRFYPAAYVARAVIVAGLLIYLWPHYTKISWRYWWLGAILGVVGIVQWVGMQLWLQGRFAIFQPGENTFDPTKAFASPAALYAFYAVRLAGAVLVVPVMEELFWRDYLWRWIIAPNDFKLAKVGEWDWRALVIVSLAFCVVHGNWALTAVAWGVMIGGLLAWTRSLGACIVMHATTNLLLGAWVLWSHYVRHVPRWDFW